MTGRELKSFRMKKNWSLWDLANKIMGPKSGKPIFYSDVSAWENERRDIPEWAVLQIRELMSGYDPSPSETSNEKSMKRPDNSDLFPKNKKSVVSLPNKNSQSISSLSGNGNREDHPEPMKNNEIRKGGTIRITISFDPESKLLMESLIGQKEFDIESIKDPVLRGILKFWENNPDYSNIYQNA